MSRQRATASAVSIGIAARSAGVAASTLRYYERLGLLVPEARSASGYRLYSAAQVERLRFIRAAKSAGFTLEDIQRMLGLSADGRHDSRSAVQSLITARLRDVQRKIDALRRVKRVLELALDRCRRSTCDCPILSELSSTGSNGEKR
jgi:DNA-binding transcriptional MerR regulator